MCDRLPFEDDTPSSMAFDTSLNNEQTILRVKRAGLHMFFAHPFQVARRGAAHLHTPGLVKVLDRLACEHNKYLRTKEQKRTARNDPGFLAMCHRISEAAKMPASPLAPQEMVKVSRCRVETVSPFQRACKSVRPVMDCQFHNHKR